MKSRKDELTQRYLLLLKLDAQNLIDRVKDRRTEFVEVFSLRRTREHFPKIFFTRYDSATIQELACCSSETIVALDQFHRLAEEMSWYLYQTEDMPATVEDPIYRLTRKLEKSHATLNLYLNAELSLDETETPITTPEAISDFPVASEEFSVSEDEEGHHG